jgi:hypothetical protein
MSGNKVGLLLTDQFSLTEPHENFQFEKAPLTTDNSSGVKRVDNRKICVLLHMHRFCMHHYYTYSRIANLTLLIQSLPLTDRILIDRSCTLEQHNVLQERI